MHQVCASAVFIRCWGLSREQAKTLMPTELPAQGEVCSHDQHVHVPPPETISPERGLDVGYMQLGFLLRRASSTHIKSGE